MVKLLVLGAVAVLLIFGGASWYKNRNNAAHTVKNIVNVQFYSTKDECEQKTKAICSQPVCESTNNTVADKICGNSGYHKGVWVPSGY
jgi:hypothetical protein